MEQVDAKTAMALTASNEADNKTYNWKTQLGRNGYILCNNNDCHMGFLSLKGMEVHEQTCTGIVKVGDFVSCPICNVRFKTFLIMERHKLRTHSSVMQSRIDIGSIDSPPIRTYERSNLANDSRILNTSAVVNNVFDDVDQDRIETADDLRLRILAESRRISSVRKPGRPPKCSYSQQRVTQLKTSDGKIINISAGPSPTINLPRPPLLSRYNSSPVIGIASHSSSFVNERPSSKLSDYSMISYTSMKQPAEDNVDSREKELAIQEAKLNEYQDRVLRYEKLAEDATRVALQEKEHKLKLLAENLRQREATAKKKLASAVHILEISKTELTSSPMYQQPPLVTSSMRCPSTESPSLPSQDCPEAFSTDDEAECEMPASASEANAPISRSAGVKYILPIPEVQLVQAEEQATPITTNDGATEHHNNIIAVQEADVSQHNHVIVINDDGKVESLLSKAQRGEVTLMAQASEDGHYFLVETPIEEHKQTTFAAESLSADKNIEVDTLTHAAVDSLQVEIVQAAESRQTHHESVQLPHLSDPKVEMILTDELPQSDLINMTVQVEEEQPIENATPSSSAILEEVVEYIPKQPEPVEMTKTEPVVHVKRKRKLAPEDIKSEPKQVAKRQRTSGKDQVPVRRSSRKNTIEISQPPLPEQPLQMEEPVDEFIAHVEEETSNAVELVIKPARRGRKSNVEKIETTHEKAEPDVAVTEEVPLKRPARGRRPNVKIEVQNEDPPIVEKIEVSQSLPEQPLQMEEPVDEFIDAVEDEPFKAVEQVIKPARRGRKPNVKKIEKKHEKAEPEPEPEEFPLKRPAQGRRPNVKIDVPHEEPLILKRGRPSNKKQKEQKEEQPQQPEPEVTSVPVVKKPPSSQSKKNTEPEKANAIACGKCERSFIGVKDFQWHAASSHGGIVKPKGEDQAMTEAEIMLALRAAFTLLKKITCFKCNQKSFTTLLGIKYHLNTCNRSKDELEAIMIQCEYCPYKGHGSNFRSHSMKHIYAERMKLIKEEEKDTTPPEISESGRVRRSAASKATKRMSAVMDTVNQDPDLIDVDLEDSDDEYMVSKDLGETEMFKQKKSGGFSCPKCDFDSKTKVGIEKHVLEYHVDEQEPDFEDGDEVVSSEMSEQDDDGLEDLEAKKSRKKYSKRKDGKSEAESSCLQNFDIDTNILSTEKKFRSINYSQNDFSEFKIEEWIPVSSMEANEYLPSESESSVDFCVKDKTISLPRFGSLQHDKDRYTFFTGGPIIASDWCPNNQLNIEVLAISAAKCFEDKEDKCLIQLWTFNDAAMPQFKAGFGLNSKVNYLKWCPSLKPLDESDKRMGILAAACSNGTVQLFTVPQDILENAGDANIMVPKPTMTLKRPGDDNTSECLKISWYRGICHRVIAASFIDGYVALWDLESRSPLLRSDPGCLMPIYYFRAHSRQHRTALTLSEDSNEIWPKSLVTGSTDRKVIVWDLTNSSGPTIVKKSTSLAVSDLTWMSHYKPHTVTAIFDDGYFLKNTRATMLDLEELSNKSGKYRFLLYNSTAWGQAYSPMLNVFIAATAAGDVIFHVGYEDKTAKKVTNGKAHNKRGFIYRSEMNANYNDMEYLKTYKQLRDHYKDLKVDFIDQDLKNLDNLSKEDLNRLKIPDAMAKEDVRKYPLLSINRVDFSPKISSRVWIFTGAQSGLARLMHITDFKQ